MKAILPRLIIGCIPLSLAISFDARGQLDVDALSERSRIAYNDIDPQVLAFYYPWYGLPSGPGGQGRSLHWGEIRPESKAIEMSTHYPLLGAYDSHDPELIAQHCRWSRDAGLDGWVVSWWEPEDYTDTAMDLIFKAAEEYGLKIAPYYESVPSPRTPTQAMDGIRYLVEEYGERSAWLQVDNRPVIFVYTRALTQLGTEGWLEVQKRLRGDEPAPVLIGDAINPMSALVFDGVHTYNPAAELAGLSPAQTTRWAEQTYRHWMATARAKARISTVTLIPGYDDTKIRTPGLRVRRHNGETYRNQWEQAIKTSPDWVLITSFNEWHEGSEIEPSYKHGAKYLQMTGDYARTFKRQPARADQSHQADATIASPVSDKALDKLRTYWKRERVALLPGTDSPAVAWLIHHLEIRPESYSWEGLVQDPPSPDDYPVLIYAGTEHYQPTVEHENDVDEVVQDYLRAGGCLVALPSKPVPFHYDLEGDTVANASKFGLFLNIGEGDPAGWEQPPDNTELRFRQPEERLPHLPRELPWPETGDLRWRPYDPASLSDKDRHIPLLELRDASDEFHGEAITYIELNETEPKGGRILYAWFNLLNQPYTDALLYDVFHFLTQELDPSGE